MGRLAHGDLMQRVEDLAVETIQVLRKSRLYERDRRLYSQLTGSIASIAANTAEANGALSEKEFCRILGIALREAYESKMHMRIISRVFEIDLSGLEGEVDQVIKILTTIIKNTKK